MAQLCREHTASRTRPGRSIRRCSGWAKTNPISSSPPTWTTASRRGASTSCGSFTPRETTASGRAPGSVRGRRPADARGTGGHAHPHQTGAALPGVRRTHGKGPVSFLNLGVGHNTPVIIKSSFWRMAAGNPDPVHLHQRGHRPRAEPARSLSQHRLRLIQTSGHRAARQSAPQSRTRHCEPGPRWWG